MAALQRDGLIERIGLSNVSLKQLEERSPDSAQDLDVLPGRAEVLKCHAAGGFLVFGLTWQPEIEAGQRSQQTLQACFDELTKRLGLRAQVSNNELYSSRM